jgi:hypothetical protein
MFDNDTSLLFFSDSTLLLTHALKSMDAKTHDLKIGARLSHLLSDHLDVVRIFVY